jgi:hypothetical protein
VPDFEATIILQVKLSAPSDTAARAFIKEALTNPANPFRLSSQPDTRLRRIIPDDGRLVSRHPNVPREQALNRLDKLSEVQLAIYGLCVRPQTLHAICASMRKQFPTVPTESVVAAITALKRDNWLTRPNGYVNLDTFPSDNALANIAALGGN